MRRYRIIGALGAAAALLVTSACADQGGSGDGGGGASVEYGADRAEYVEALQDMEPVELTIQSTGPQGSATGRRFEAYAEAVEDWSGGKITFNFFYSNAVAPPTEVHQALADGRLDIGSVMPALVPAEFPAANALNDLSHLGRQLPVDWMLQWHGIMLDMSAAIDDVDEEYEAKDMKLLLPAFGSGAYMPYCAEGAESAEDVAGRGVATQSGVQNRESEALGMNPMSISYNEMFEALERRVVDCALTTVTGAALGGYIAAAPHVLFDEETGFNAPGGSIAMSLARWNELPLAAQQLMVDRLDVLMQANFEGAWENTSAAVEQVLSAGGSFAPLPSSATDALVAVHDEVERGVAEGGAVADGEALVEMAREFEQEWADRIDALGLEGIGTSYEEFPQWYADGAPDLQRYFDALWEGAMGARRPA
ncbi:TRAP transporter substrate-binding protein DctP [uncultured Aeromicrobium sp.]|uniref:TRAP transporter substrate-binding protein DctP n=1 Tax=uncultured Aeromicrobium sp. TaxID=337820 RepID=UPI0025EFFD6F|nr:TRAP transporter substrate-binding protein DctP [uncultured Aeromicrobium sp.]